MQSANTNDQILILCCSGFYLIHKLHSEDAMESARFGGGEDMVI